MASALCPPVCSLDRFSTGAFTLLALIRKGFVVGHLCLACLLTWLCLLLPKNVFSLQICLTFLSTLFRFLVFVKTSLCFYFFLRLVTTVPLMPVVTLTLGGGGRWSPCAGIPHREPGVCPSAPSSCLSGRLAVHTPPATVCGVLGKTLLRPPPPPVTSRAPLLSGWVPLCGWPTVTHAQLSEALPPWAWDS